MTSYLGGTYGIVTRYFQNDSEFHRLVIIPKSPRIDDFTDISEEDFENFEESVMNKYGVLNQE